jgi:hypothetical protein
MTLVDDDDDDDLPKLGRSSSASICATLYTSDCTEEQFYTLVTT